MAEEIWITGVGLVTSIGIGRETFWSAALAGTSGGIRLPFPLLEDDQLATRIGAPIQGFDPVAAGIPPKDVPILDQVTRFTLAAAQEAIQDAGFELELINPRKGLQGIRGVDPERTGVIIGTGIGGLTTCVENVAAWHDTRRKTACKRYALPMLIPNAPAAQVAIRYQARGECKSVTTACAAGTMAIGDAFRTLRADEADVMICGGAEALLSDPEVFALTGFDLLRTMTRRNDEPTRASRPFDRDRDGFLMSEGAGVLILERASFARARGARPYARLASYASTCDASSIMQIDQDGEQIERVMRLAVERARIDPVDVDYINAHGTATTLNDKVESQAIRRAFGAHADALAVTSTKSMTGHAIAASGAIEAIATALSVYRGMIPPTINLDNPDPECTLDYVPHTAREQRVRTALSNSFGFGGHNACLVIAAP